MYWMNGSKCSARGCTCSPFSTLRTFKSRSVRCVDITFLYCRLLSSVCHDHRCMFQLQTEFKRFSTVDKNWRATLLAAKAQPQVRFSRHKIHFAFSWSYDCYRFVYHQKSFVFVTFVQYHALMIALNGFMCACRPFAFVRTRSFLRNFRNP